MLTYLMVLRPLRNGLRLARGLAPQGFDTDAIAAVLASVATTVSMSGPPRAARAHVSARHKRNTIGR
jgi:hypothetical protein